MSNKPTVGNQTTVDKCHTVFSMVFSLIGHPLESYFRGTVQVADFFVTLESGETEINLLTTDTTLVNDGAILQLEFLLYLHTAPQTGIIVSNEIVSDLICGKTTMVLEKDPNAKSVMAVEDAWCFRIHRV